MKFTGIGTAINNDFHSIDKFKRIHDLILYNGSRIESDIKKLLKHYTVACNCQIKNLKFD